MFGANILAIFLNISWPTHVIDDIMGPASASLQASGGLGSETSDICIDRSRCKRREDFSRDQLRPTFSGYSARDPSKGGSLVSLPQILRRCAGGLCADWRAGDDSASLHNA